MCYKHNNKFLVLFFTYSIDFFHFNMLHCLFTLHCTSDRKSMVMSCPILMILNMLLINIMQSTDLA
jgi:hypothetical protein